MESFSTAQRAFAEAVGTALLVFIGAGSVPAILLLEGGTKAPFSGADLGFISMAFGLIVVALVYTVGKVSGCHINPAVTFGLAVTKRFPWREVPLYWSAQVAGSVPSPGPSCPTGKPLPPRNSARAPAPISSIARSAIAPDPVVWPTVRSRRARLLVDEGGQAL